MRVPLSGTIRTERDAHHISVALRRRLRVWSLVSLVPNFGCLAALSAVMAPNTQQIVALLERTLTERDPITALDTLMQLRRRLDALEHAQAARALQSGSSFAQVARPLGISRQAAHRRYRRLAASPPPRPRPRPTLAPEARAALVRARREAARHGSISVDGTHLLLALAEQRGVDVTRARRSLVAPTVVAAVPSGLHPELYARLTRSVGTLELDHLVHAALEAPEASSALAPTRPRRARTARKRPAPR